MTQRKCRAGIRRASEEGRGADQCARTDSVGRGTEGGGEGGGEGGEERERSSIGQINRTIITKLSPPTQTRRTRHTAVSPAGSQVSEGREPVERAGLDARYRFVVEVPWGGEGRERAQRKTGM